MKFNIPEEIINIIKKLQSANFEAYLVGGCVRDILMNREPKDWDITTNAKPEEIQKLFPNNIYENKFGTVAVKTDSDDEQLKIIEITTFRLEGKYTDKRHPDEVKFAKTVEEDLSRRDFTINAIALKPNTQNLKPELVDPYNGQEDIKNKLIRSVGEPEKRFNEDALRLMRAIRFSVQLGWEIEKKTFAALKKEAGFIEMIAKERIRDEFIKIIMSSLAKKGIELLEEVDLLKFIVPELRQGINNGQNKHHIYTIWEHNLRALDYAVKKNYGLEIRLASLLHDIGKPNTKAGEGLDCTFYNHEVVGAKITVKIMDDLRFPKDIAEKVIHLVRYHLFYYNVGEVTESGVRRFLSRVGAENVDDLIKVREADRIGSGVPKAVPYKLRHLLFMIEKVKRDPISPKMLKVNGEDVMKILKIQPGPKIGMILSILLDEVIDEPSKNRIKNLELRIKELGNLTDDELKKIAKVAREKKEEFESGIEEEIKRKYYVK
ncbi:hypothetical protein COS33_00445 [Candidatus Wolfebacteria bacterium CG02_land_8_20_14_3_00_37_12]|uniref:HD domain-containing protein n=1 Tax=Candidatus Wolfebacteria bacterium CG02_land_8_20_14_3_00_37_12 TaxID=1975066 RepID=A0A2M7CQK3_9BACT|nr:MAG: hypothetical protein COS33_00445 [Candidatus Wolfebacteria bacterium CG02_land_8_20_14_3_00_37_12]